MSEPREDSNTTATISIQCILHVRLLYSAHYRRRLDFLIRSDLARTKRNTIAGFPIKMKRKNVGQAFLIGKTRQVGPGYALHASRQKGRLSRLMDRKRQYPDE